MHPDEFSNQLDQLLEAVDSVPPDYRHVDHLWHVLLCVRDLIPQDWLTMAPGWFEGVITLGPFTATEYLSIQSYPRFATPARYRARMQGVADHECNQFLDAKPMPAYGGKRAQLIDLRRHGDPSRPESPIGFLWTLGVNAVHIDPDSNRYVNPPPGFWLREASHRRVHRDTVYFHSLTELTTQIFEGMRQWYAYRFGPEGARLQAEEAVLDDGGWKLANLTLEEVS